MTMATITVLGRLGRDPELKITQTGKKVVNFSLAVDDGFGENKHTTWFRCIAWEKTGESIEKFFRKGDTIVVLGAPVSREWDKDGQAHTVLEVNVQKWSFTGQKREEHKDPDAQGKGQYKAPEIDDVVPF